ncbi:MAG: ACT domain-containing protein [Verrucomicrobiota bacterium]
MQTTLVMTVIGPDRTGLVESIARLVAEHGGNWLESRMCRLGGEFAGIVRVAVPASQRPMLEAALGQALGPDDCSALGWANSEHRPSDAGGVGGYRAGPTRHCAGNHPGTERAGHQRAARKGQGFGLRDLDGPARRRGQPMPT